MKKNNSKSDDCIKNNNWHNNKSNPRHHRNENTDKINDNITDSNSK